MEECPPLETKRQRLALVGKLVLHGWEDNVRTGWFLGRVARKHVTARDRQYVPTANYVVRYTAAVPSTLITFKTEEESGNQRIYTHQKQAVLRIREQMDLYHFRGATRMLAFAKSPLCVAFRCLRTVLKS